MFRVASTVLLKQLCWRVTISGKWGILDVSSSERSCTRSTWVTNIFACSDQMGNKGAFITMGSDVKPNFTTYDAVVSSIVFALITFFNGKKFYLEVWFSETSPRSSTERSSARPERAPEIDPSSWRKLQTAVHIAFLLAVWLVASTRTASKTHSCVLAKLQHLCSCLKTWSLLSLYAEVS